MELHNRPIGLGLFNPPGVTPSDKDVDDLIPFSGFD